MKRKKIAEGGKRSLLSLRKGLDFLIGKFREPISQPIPEGVETVHLYRGMDLSRRSLRKVKDTLNKGYVESPALYFFGEGYRADINDKWGKKGDTPPYLFLVKNSEGQEHFGVSFWTKKPDYASVYGDYILECDVPRCSVVNQLNDVEFVTGPVETPVYNPMLKKLKYDLED